MEIRTLHVYPPNSEMFSVQVGSQIRAINAVVSKIEKCEDYFAVWVNVEGSPHSHPWKDIPIELHPIVEYAVTIKALHRSKG